MRISLADDIDLLPPPCHRFTDYFFGTSRRIHFGGVD
jgi:hypothetical protein